MPALESLVIQAVRPGGLWTLLLQGQVGSRCGMPALGCPGESCPAQEPLALLLSLLAPQLPSCIHITFLAIFNGQKINTDLLIASIPFLFASMLFMWL